MVWHILLRQHDGPLLRPVVAVVEEDDHVALLDRTVHAAVVDGLDELVRHALVIAVLHGLGHIGGLMALAADEQVVGRLDTFPALVAVHRIEAAHDAGDGSARHLAALLRELPDEALAAARIRVAAVHEAVHERILDAVPSGDVHQGEQVIQAAVHAAVTGQSHQVHALAVGLGVLVGRHHLGVLQDAAVLAGTVNLHQVLIHDAPGADVQVAHLAVAHLSVGQSHVLAAGQQLRVGISLFQIVQIGRRSLINHVALTAVSDAPSVEDHQ